MGNTISQFDAKDLKTYNEYMTGLAELFDKHHKATELAKLIESTTSNPEATVESYTNAWPRRDAKPSEDPDTVTEFLHQFNNQRSSTDAFLQVHHEKWATDPGSFWGWPERSDATAKAAIKRVYAVNDGADTDLLKPMRRRIARAAFVNLRDMIHDRMLKRTLKMPHGVKLKAMANHILFMAISDNKTVEIDPSTFNTRVRDGERLIRLPPGTLLRCGRLTTKVLEQVDDTSFEKIVAHLSSQGSNQTFSSAQSTLMEDLLSDFNDDNLDVLIDSGHKNYSGSLHIVKKRKTSSKRKIFAAKLERKLIGGKKAPARDKNSSPIGRIKSPVQVRKSQLMGTGWPGIEQEESIQEPRQDTDLSGPALQPTCPSGEPISRAATTLLGTTPSTYLQPSRSGGGPGQHVENHEQLSQMVQSSVTDSTYHLNMEWSNFWGAGVHLDSQDFDEAWQHWPNSYVASY